MTHSELLEDKINSFMFSVIESNEYKNVEYLIFTIRKTYLDYLSGSRLTKFEIPIYLKSLVDLVVEKFNNSKITANEMLDYMMQNDMNGWVHYYTYAFIEPVAKGKALEVVPSLNDLFALVLTAYILDLFGETKIDIRTITENEKLLHTTNQYGLSIVNGVEFKRDYFIFENKSYLYNILTQTTPIKFGDTMPAFARLIVDNVQDGNILLRLDERLALPAEQAITYSSLDFEKYYGPQFHFRDSILKQPKTITVHIDDETCDKLLMVVKQDYDTIKEQPFWHIEIETLPYIEENTSSSHCITTFLHGMYYPENDTFSHIDCTKNQYATSDYLQKYSESNENMPIDLYTEKGLHYKIWCIENGQYSKNLWYDLMMVSLSDRYKALLDEILM